ncbi:MAG: tRNA (5-methylaminomethyl-2-thiouridine)(34)-methyltransferase MnmD [Methylotenera sp.]|uniref:tRNA (5-methylaminomethyl-2-thiouridine)(34)-methyltransferase MnmD n=1 Tax=Methylotenera sp. TaxID=2051956 RepID=UPI00272F3B91|nr:tRNA (5-methylaminomethyl-2-thiouridine)(34)-methyltransferase MnmD [Methylotenera sp.]MDP1521966.1 tRNA (5-methylaminomethyl-2-thiouridine)(34)-methyltransferase MnmD [Methylotenera sp.]
MRVPNKPKNYIAKVEWRNGQPYASAFDDVYFSTDNGLLETDYVFLQGNHLQSRWQNLTAKNFTIAETGFGTGLNFLCAVKLWLETTPQDAALHFISVEKYPLNLPDITAALTMWPQLQGFSEPLLAQYVQLISGVETITLFNNRIRLTILIGDATERLSQVENKIDAWFLDGFAPVKNPDMWQAVLFEEMARLSYPTATFSTFTSAGEVRRALIKAGFSVSKQTGFGKKREMLIGYFVGNVHDA